MTDASRTRTTAVVAGGQLAMNAAAYVFSVVAARLLIPAEFGALTALLGILQMGSVACLGLQAAAARRIAVNLDRRAETTGIVIRSTLLAATACGLAVAAAAPLITTVLHLGSLWPALLCAATLVPMTTMGGFAGIAQGTERWGVVTTIALANGLGRLGAGAVAVAVEPTVTSAMIGVAVGAWAPALVGVVTLGVRQVSTHTRRPLLREAILGTHTLFAFYVLSNIDALIARNRFDAQEAGLYGAGLILGKVALMTPSFVGIMLFPRLARDSTTASRRQAVAVVSAIGVLAVGATALLPRVALILAGGGQYAEIAGHLWLFTLAGSSLAIAQVLVLDALARRAHRVARLVWTAVAVVPLLAAVAHVDVVGLVSIVAAAAAALSAALWLVDRR